MALSRDLQGLRITRKVVCIATTGNVFSKDAVKELCFKRNCLGGPVGRDALPEGGRYSLHDPDDKDLVEEETWPTSGTCKKSGRSATPSWGRKDRLNKQTPRRILAEAKRNVEAREAQRFLWKSYICSMAWRMPIPHRGPHGSLLEAQRLAKEKARQEALNAPDRPENRASRRRISASPATGSNGRGGPGPS